MTGFSWIFHVVSACAFEDVRTYIRDDSTVSRPSGAETKIITLWGWVSWRPIINLARELAHAQTLHRPCPPTKGTTGHTGFITSLR